MQLSCPAPLLGDTQGSPLSAPFTPEKGWKSLSAQTPFFSTDANGREQWDPTLLPIAMPSTGSSAHSTSVPAGNGFIYMLVPPLFPPPPIPHPKTKTETERNHCAPLLLRSITLLWPKNTTGEGKAIVCPPSSPPPSPWDRTPHPTQPCCLFGDCSATVIFSW